MNKVKLPREVAEAIDHMKHAGIHNLIENVVNMHAYECTTTQLAAIRKYFHADWRLLVEALLYGYEVEQTPQEKVRELHKKYANAKTGAYSYECGYNIGARNAIPEVLNLLNIKIDGVNT